MITTQHSSTIQSTSLDFGRSKSVGFFHVINSTIWKELLYLKRYKANLVGGFLQMGIMMFMFYIFSTSAQFRNLNYTKEELYTFFLSGMCLIFFAESILWQPMNTVRTDLTNGTLEYLYSTPSNKFAYFLGSIFGVMILNSIMVFPMYIALMLYANLGIESMLQLLGITIIYLTCISAFGIIVGALTILWKQVAGVVNILNALFQFIGGAFLPVAALPGPIRVLSYILPVTYGLDVARYVAFKGSWTTLLPIQTELIILVIYGIFYTFVAIWFLNKVERKAKETGLHEI